MVDVDNASLEHDDDLSAKVRRDVHALAGEAPPAYLDSAASSLTPEPVLDAMLGYYRTYRANIHRGRHAFAERASEAFEEARQDVAALFAAAPREIIFTAGATAGINLVALGLELQPGDNVVTTRQEHHSNLLPFLDRAEVRMLPTGAAGEVDPEALVALVDERTRLVTLSMASNVTGAILPVAEVAALARKRGVPVLVDAAQGAAHLPVDVHELGCDFLVASAHKMLGPTGVGVLWATVDAQARLHVALRGGGAVRLVEEGGFQLKTGPARFEAGTPPIAEVIGFGAAARYLQDLDMARVAAHDLALGAYMREQLSDLPGLSLIGPPPGADRLAIASLVPTHPGVSADHLAMVLSDRFGVMVRSGHHCCHPFFDALGMTGSLRASGHAYSTRAEVDRLRDALRETVGRLVQ